MDADFLMQIIKILFKEDTLMNTTAEMKIEISIERDCILIEASKLSLTDAFMRYKPKTEEEKAFKATLTEVIKNGIEDFYRPVMDPSFANKEKTKIHFLAGEEPAVGKSCKFWNEFVKDTKWCLGTKAQYVAFLGVLIKILIDKGWSYTLAWKVICNDPRRFGGYWNYFNPQYQLRNTGSDEFYGFFDLANTYKFLAKDEEIGACWVAGGNYTMKKSLANLELTRFFYDIDFDKGVPWLVLKK